MGFHWAQNHVRPVGIDFGADSLKLLQVSTADPPELLAAASASVPTEVRDDLNLRLEFFADALRRLMREGQFKGKRVVLSIPAAHTFVQHVRIGKSESAAIDDQVAAELHKQLGVDAACLVMRRLAVGEVFADGATRQESICLVAARQIVMQHLNAARRAGLNVVGMYCEPLAIMEAFAHRFRRAEDEDRVTLFLDVGYRTTKAMIAHGRSLVFAKIIEVAGKQLARASQESMEAINTDAQADVHAGVVVVKDAVERPVPSAVIAGPDGQAAEQSLAVLNTTSIEQDRRSEDAPLGTPLPNAPSAAPDSIATEMFDSLVDELQLCIGYHASIFSKNPVQSAIFLGGEARHTDRCQAIAQALRLPAQVGDPLARLARHAECKPPVDVDLRSPQPGWAVPLGLCLSKASF